MRCAIDSVAFILADKGIKSQVLLDELEATIGEKGICLHDVIVVANKHKLLLEARKGFFLPKRLPSILYYKQRGVGHYNVLVKKTRYRVIIYDSQLGMRTIHKWWFYLFYSHIYIVCYND